MTDFIEVKGAKTHNLKNIDVKIPKNQLVVITGLSGSGKSSLAFDTIYAEGQRKYVESLSAYARQFLGVMDKPEVEMITGLSPAISIDQKTSGHNPRSTVGTITEIYDYLRLLYARVGNARSPITGNKLQYQTIQEIVDSVMNLPEKLGLKDEKLKIMVHAPVVKNRKGTYAELFNRFLAQGFARARVDGVVYSLEEEIKLEKHKKHNIDIVIDRLALSSEKLKDEDFVKRLTDSVESALNLGEQELLVELILPEALAAETEAQINAKTNFKGKKGNEKGEFSYDIFFSEKYVDPANGISFPEVQPHTFSFNSPYGACEKCNGLGSINEVSPNLVLNENLSVTEGGIYPLANVADDKDSWRMRVLQAVADEEGFDLRKPLSKLSEKQREILLYGNGKKLYEFSYVRKRDGREQKYDSEFEGIIPNLMRRYQETDSDYARAEIEKYMVERTCDVCKGTRLREHALAVTIHGMNIVDVTNLSISNAKTWIQAVKDSKTDYELNDTAESSYEYVLGLKPNTPAEDTLSEQALEIGSQIFKEIESRLDFLVSVGLNYLTLSRTAKTLSGGESQRIRLASQIGTGLTGVLYVLDEPSIGLHQRDNSKLIDTLKNLRDIGNTVLVVEHDEDTIRESDYILDMGPGAGEHGGQITAAGSLKEILANKDSKTAEYLSGAKKITKESVRKQVTEISGEKFDEKPVDTRPHLSLMGCSLNNLQDVTLEFPLNSFVSITGVSGSGKSSLINETLHPILAKHFYRAKQTPGPYKQIKGLESLDKVVNIDQSPIGRTPRSNPATYTGMFTQIRDVFAKTKEARIRGYKPGRFSFNVKGGRCETCKGDGVIKIEMQFLSDVYVKCDVCKGQRYNREALQIDYKGKNIAEVLEMTVEEGTKFFENIPAIHNKLKTLLDVGLGYIRLGQPATTLSGGEAQRVKLATELSKRSTGKTIFILDEPTTGLHFEDVNKLLVVLHTLVAKGNTVLVIEHNLDVVKTSDWIIDLGPEGGINGGEIIAEGTPEQLKKNKRSYTGEWLEKLG